MPRRQKEARIAFAHIFLGEEPEKGEQIPLVGLGEALVESIVPGTTVTRYNRTWHMARYEREGRHVMGHIGFDVATSAVWDEALKDFLEVRPAQVTLFAVDLEQMRVSFQLRGKAIKPGTFQGNFEALLNAARTPYRWTVRLEGVEQPPWEEWRERVERITEVSATLVRPNPHYDFEEIERMFVEGKLAQAQIGGKGDNINPEGGILKAAIEYVLNGYGRLRAKGVTVVLGTGTPDAWNSDAESGVRKKEVPLDPETGELAPEDLKEALDEPIDGDESIDGDQSV